MYDSYRDKLLEIGKDFCIYIMSFIGDLDGEDKTKIMFWKPELVYYRNAFGFDSLDAKKPDGKHFDTILFVEHELNKVLVKTRYYNWNHEVPQIYVYYIGSKKFFKENKEKTILKIKSMLIEDITKERKRLQKIESNIIESEIEE